MCDRDQATCRRKILLSSWQESNAWVEDYNASRGWQPPYVTRYRCRWCDGWHLKTAGDVRTRARMEKLARKRRAGVRPPDW